MIRVLEPDGLAGIGENAVGLIDPDGGLITAQYGVGRARRGRGVGGGSIWWPTRRRDRCRGSTAAKGQVVTIPVGGGPHGLAFGTDSLWIADGDGRSVAQIDPGSEQGSATRSTPATRRLAWRCAAARCGLHPGSTDGLDRIEIGRAPGSRPILLGANPTAMAAGAGALWVASEEAGTVTRVEPRSAPSCRRSPSATVRAPSRRATARRGS